MSLTPEAVLALAPDASSAKAAMGLVRPAQWPLLGAREAAVWGECQGSGAKPYQTQVDLSGPAFRCTCPSRKFPCKHGLALLLMQAQQAASFTAGDPPAWVSEWLAGRVAKAEKQAEKATAPAAGADPADPAATQRRDAQRWQRIEAAAQDLQRWLADQLARGLGALDDTARDGWGTMARRMVDAQAPGLGQRLLEAAAGLRRGEDWIARTLQHLGLLQLACEGLTRRTQLSAAEQHDLRVVAGWPLDRDEVLAQGLHEADRWRVIGCAVEPREERLTERRVWLQGERSGRRALVLDHAFGGRGFEQSWVVGQAVEATLAFFPGASGLRALLAGTATLVGPPPWPRATLAEEWAAMARRVAACPWVPLHPLVVPGATAVPHASGLQLVACGRALPTSLDEGDSWLLLAQSGGQPLDVAGEWNGRRFAPLAAWAGNELMWKRRTA